MEITKKILLGIIGLLIIFLIIFPRSSEFLSGNYIFGFDQGRDYLAVKQIVVDKKLTLIGSELGAGSAGLSGIFHGPGYYYLLALGFLVSKGDPYSGIVLMFFLSLATAVFSFYLGKKVFGIVGGIFVAILVSISPVLVSQARFAWNSHPSSLFILLVLFFVYSFLSSKKYKYLFFAGFFSGFIYNFQTGIAVPLCITLLIYTIFILRLKRPKAYAILFGSFFLGFFPMIFFEIKHGFMVTKGILQYLLSSHASKISYLANVQDHLGTFIYNFFDTFPRQFIVPSTIIFLLFIISLGYYLKKEKDNVKRNFMFYLMLIPFVTFFIFSFLKNAVYPHYLTHLNMVYIFLLGYVGQRAFAVKQRIILGFFCIFIGILLWNAVPDAYKTFIKDYNDYGGDAKIRGKIDAVEYIYHDAKKKKFNLLVFTPPVYTYAYDYVIWWYGKTKYNYVPSTEKKGIFYLLIEKDPGKPWSYEGWLETVIKTGNVVYTKTLPSEFIVQKRIQND